jgi:hypothetical protein
VAQISKATDTLLVASSPTRIFPIFSPDSAAGTSDRWTIYFDLFCLQSEGGKEKNSSALLAFDFISSSSWLLRFPGWKKTYRLG